MWKPLCVKAFLCKGLSASKLRCVKAAPRKRCSVKTNLSVKAGPRKGFSVWKLLYVKTVCAQSSFPQTLVCAKSSLCKSFCVCVKAALFKGWNPPCLQTYSWKHFLQTFLGNLAWGPVPWNLAWQLFRNPCLGTLPGNLFLGTCKYGSQKGFPSKIPGTVSKQGSKQEQGSQEQILKQAFPGRAGSKAKFPGQQVKFLGMASPVLLFKAADMLQLEVWCTKRDSEN